MMTHNNEEQHALVDRIQRPAATAAGAGLAITLIGGLFAGAQFFQSFLLAYLFWIALPLGCLAFLMIHHVTAGGWGFAGQRFFEAGARTIPWMALLFVVILIGLRTLYPWADPEQVAASKYLAEKTIYLNPSFFIARAIVFFGVWTILAYVLSNLSATQDVTGDSGITNRLHAISAGGLLAFVITGTFSAIDWGMSLEPMWFSSIYGAKLMVGHGLSTLAFVILMLALFRNCNPLSDFLTTRHFHHLGNLLLGFVVLWAYIAFSEFLIIWSANLPDPIEYYIARSGAGLTVLSVILMLFHFAVPMFVLLAKRSKRTLKYLVPIAAGILIMRVIDYIWLINPAFTPGQLRISVLDITALIGVGGLWLVLFARELRSRPLLPQHDPRIDAAAAEAQHEEALEHA